MASMTLFCWANSAAWRRMSAPWAFSVLGRPGAGEDAERRVIGPAEVLAAESGSHLDGPLDVVEALCARTAASGLIGLASGLQTVTVVQPRPRLSSSLLILA